MCRGGSKILLDSEALVDVPSVLLAPMTVAMASSYSCIGQYLLNCPFHTSSNKSSCRPVTVLYL